MSKTISPSIETTKDLILIKIPRRLFAGEIPREKLSRLEKGLRESMKEAGAGKIYGPYRTASAFLRALKK
ncbi:MAG: hypothetical protein Q8Q97_01170 [bacterium]|nr:hypothetical protein [bacterium]